MPVSQIHPFERARFGHAPYRCVGHRRAVYQACPGAPMQPGATCDYCGTAIMDVYMVRSADGIEFKVGSDCVGKVYRDFAADIPADFRAEFLKVEQAKRDAKRQVVHARVAARVERTATALEAEPRLFVDRPHPNEYWAKQGRTLRDYYEWMLKHAGDAGRTTVCKEIELTLALVKA